ncbi:MAG: DUF3667 domain-containing protein [Flavobacterium sp.]|nr:DUF3667 domain-containing protein [Flavobacterium sp.]
MIKKKLKQYRGYECLNCETPLDISEKYCHHCGQLNSTKKLTISDFFEEFFANFYAYDSRLRNSFISLFSKPGILAKEFNEGKRQKYANPFRLFLSVSILLFIILGITEKLKKDYIQYNEDSNQEEIIQIQDSIHINIAEEKSKANIKDKILINRNFSKDSIYKKSDFDNNTIGLFYTISSFKNFSQKYPQKEDYEALLELGYDNTTFNRFFI